MALVPQICDAVSVPVIAAGGIADGRGVAAAFMLGAQAVQMGTRFLSAQECSIHPVYREKILKATDLCTMVTGKRLGHPVRSLRTEFARDYAKAEYGGMPDEELEALGAGALRRAAAPLLPAPLWTEIRKKDAFWQGRSLRWSKRSSPPQKSSGKWHRKRKTSSGGCCNG